MNSNAFTPPARPDDLSSELFDTPAPLALSVSAAAPAYLGDRAAELGTHNDEPLQKRHDMLAALLDLHGAGTLLADRSGTVLFVSRSAERLIGHPREHLCGRPWQEALVLGPDDRCALFDRIRRQERDSSLVARLLHDDGSRHSVGIEIKSARGFEDHVMLILHDLGDIYDLPSVAPGEIPPHGLIGDSLPMRLVQRQIEDLARVDSTVLLSGETGTGKELVARAIHQSSERRHKPYVSVNCAGLTESLSSSQLFGHRRGAFTGAVADHIGFVEAAEGGTLFLDEIGDIPPSLQTMLLRFLQEREIVRLGESKPRRVNARIILATHRDLSGAVAAGSFREDLYYRIRVAQIELPPLRERLDDLPILVASFIADMRAATRKPVRDLSREAMLALTRHRWPGNVRELRSTIEAAVVRSRGAVIEASDLPREVASVSEDGGDRLRGALQQSGGNRAAAARMLGISRATFYRRLDALKDASTASAR